MVNQLVKQLSDCFILSDESIRHMNPDYFAAMLSGIIEAQENRDLRQRMQYWQSR